MAAIITSKFRFHNADSFIEGFAEAAATNMYLGIGRPQTWTTDTSPPTPTDDISSEFAYWDDMIALKRITTSDVNTAIARRNWTTATVYDEYHDNYSSSHTATSGATSLYSARFVVMNSSYQVYKCISNNNGGTSTVEPTGTGSTIISTADSYKWKYMYSIQPGDVLKFVTTDFIPVDTDATVSAAAIDGAIHHIRVATAGTGYPASSTTIPLFVNGDGTLVATGSATAAVTAGAITSVSSIAGGSGYPTSQTALPVMLRQVTATGVNETAFGTATTDSSGVITAVTLVIAGSSYTAGTVAIVSSSCRALGTTNGSGAFTSVAVANGNEGTGFTYTTVTPVTATGSGTSLVAIISPKGGHGYNAVEELGGFFVMLNVRLEYAESDGSEADFPVNNDYRRLIVVRDPYNFGTSVVATATTLDAMKSLTVTKASTTGTFTVDELIYGNATGATGRVVDFITDPANSANWLIKYFQSSVEKAIVFTTTDDIVGGTSGATATTVSSVNNPEVQPDSGDIMYVEQRRPINRASDQIEDIKLVIEF